MKTNLGQTFSLKFIFIWRSHIKISESGNFQTAVKTVCRSYWPKSLHLAISFDAEIEFGIHFVSDSTVTTSLVLMSRTDFENTIFASAFDELSESVNVSLIEFLQFWPNMSHMFSHGPNLICLNLMIYILEVTSNEHVQHRFSNLRCNMASFKCTNNLLTRGCNRFSKTRIWLPD